MGKGFFFSLNFRSTWGAAQLFPGSKATGAWR